MLTMHFLLQDPMESLKTPNTSLSQFTSLSGYKINESKSIIMGLSVSPETKKILSTVSNAVWSSNVKYLGIRPMDPTSIKVLDLNLRPVVNKVQNQLPEWQKL